MYKLDTTQYHATFKAQYDDDGDDDDDDDDDDGLVNTVYSTV